MERYEIVRSGPMSDEIKKRVCRCIGRKFEYPVAKSGATRFHCPDRAVLKPELRKIFEQLTRRLKRHEAEIEKLKKQHP